MGNESEEMEFSRLHLIENNSLIRNSCETNTNVENTDSEDNNNPGIAAILETLSALKINLSSIDIAVHRILRHKMTVRKDSKEAEIKLKWRLVALIWIEYSCFYI